jgi:hypothetical protein
MQTPFHEGELKVQRLAGEQLVAERNSGAIGSRIMGGALPFLAQQSMAVFSSRDGEGRLWASMLFGARGFMSSVDGHSVAFELSQMLLQAEDPFWRNIEAEPKVGLLVIELGSRRRLRVNGSISRLGEGRLLLSVKESYPNCPKYITRRVVQTVATGEPAQQEERRGSALGLDQKQLLASADTLFIATAHPSGEADASHRGGSPGFIEALDEQTLRIPDYLGNGMYNTFGNLALDSSAGLIVPDFEHGLALQLTGKAALVFDGDDPGEVSGGTHRFLIFHIDHWQQRPLPAGVQTQLLDDSPYNPQVRR